MYLQYVILAHTPVMPLKTRSGCKPSTHQPISRSLSHYAVVLFVMVGVIVFFLQEGRKEMFYLTTHSTHFIYGYMASDIW